LITIKNQKQNPLPHKIRCWSARKKVQILKMSTSRWRYVQIPGNSFSRYCSVRKCLKICKGLLIARLTTHTELLNTLTDRQLGTKPDMQTHDAIYCLFSIIQHNKYTLDKPTHVVFVDYSTAYLSVHRDGLSSTLLKNDIRGNMW